MNPSHHPYNEQGILGGSDGGESTRRSWLTNGWSGLQDVVGAAPLDATFPPRNIVSCVIGSTNAEGDPPTGQDTDGWPTVRQVADSPTGG